MQITFSETLAYQPKQFFALGSLIASWCQDESLFAGFPGVVSDNGRTYYFSQFGHCPSDSGCTMAFAFDSHNDLYRCWSQEDSDFNFDITFLENLDVAAGLEFSTLEELEIYIRTGDLPS